MNVVIAKARVSPLLILVEIPEKNMCRAHAHLEMICFDKDVLHVWRKLPASPRNHLTVLLQAELSKTVPAKEATTYVSDVSKRDQRSGYICLQVNKLNLPVLNG